MINKLLYVVLGRKKYLLRQYKRILKYWESPKRTHVFLCPYVKYKLKDPVLYDDLKKRLVDISSNPELFKQTLYNKKRELTWAVEKDESVWHTSRADARIGFLRHVIRELETQ